MMRKRCGYETGCDAGWPRWVAHWFVCVRGCVCALGSLCFSVTHLRQSGVCGEPQLHPSLLTCVPPLLVAIAPPWCVTAAGADGQAAESAAGREGCARTLIDHRGDGIHFASSSRRRPAGGAAACRQQGRRANSRSSRRQPPAGSRRQGDSRRGAPHRPTAAGRRASSSSRHSGGRRRAGGGSRPAAAAADS